ncbi:hypothetical protein Tco_0617146 [Tanacetum coccineum]
MCLTLNTLTQFYAKYFVPEEVHPQLPSSDATMHERPAGKVGMYTRFFDYANYHGLNAFICTADPRKVRIVERARAENERPIVTVAKHRTVTLLPTSVVRPSEELVLLRCVMISEPIMPITDNVKLNTGPKRTKKKREGLPAGVIGTPAASQTPKELKKLISGTTEGIPALPTLPFITSSVTASPLEEGEDHTDSVTGPSLPTVGPSARFVVLSDSSHHSGAKSADPEVDSLVRSVAPVMTTATTVTAFISSVAATAPTAIDAGKNKDVPAPSVFACSISSDRTGRTLSLFTGRSSQSIGAGALRAGKNAD